MQRDAYKHFYFDNICSAESWKHLDYVSVEDVRTVLSVVWNIM